MHEAEYLQIKRNFFYINIDKIPEQKAKEPYQEWSYFLTVDVIEKKMFFNE